MPNFLCLIACSLLEKYAENLKYNYISFYNRYFQTKQSSDSVPFLPLKILFPFDNLILWPFPRWAELPYYRRVCGPESSGINIPGRTTLEGWLARWALHLSDMKRFSDLPLYLQYLCKILFHVVDRTGKYSWTSDEYLRKLNWTMF